MLKINDLSKTNNSNFLNNVKHCRKTVLTKHIDRCNVVDLPYPSLDIFYLMCMNLK